MRCPACGNENREEARFCDSCGTELRPESEAAQDGAPAEVLPSDVPAEIAERYRVQRFLGQGGRKRVYLAQDSSSKAEVAVALFDTEGVAAAVQARAKREAEAMRKLGDNPHVVSVLDTGEQDGNPFIVSEYMPGGDVEGLLASEGGRLPVERAAEIAADVCRALEHAHARGIVHRDLKPANVWLDDDGNARLGDFGLATTEGRSRVSGGTLVGTVAYLPPEQALGDASGPASDLYSLGALLYEMLTGQPPFSGDDAVSIISQHLHADPVPPSRQNKDVPEALDRVVLSLLAKREEDRPSGAAEARAQVVGALDEPEAEAGEEREENPLDSLAGGVFVGREGELESMRRAVDAALGGHGSLQMLVGEPGIGKTRAAEELATYARVSGARVHWGRCREDDGAPAYWPWVQAIRTIVRDADPVALAWQMGGGAADIAQLVPEVAEKLDIEPAPPGESEEARFQLFDSMTNYLIAVARDRPLVVVLDDLHWADEPTLLLLRFAARELGESGLLLVGTYRDVELGRHHPLARVLGELSATEGSGKIVLRGLSTDAVARYIEMSAGAEPPPGLAEAVQAQTEGNPFFVGEIVRLLASEGKLKGVEPGADLEIPQGVREVIGRRLDRLSEETNEALRVAAVAGRDFEAELVWRVAELDEKELMAAAQEAIAERLVGDSGGGRFSFSHALVRDTLYGELSPAQRSALHEKMGLALEDLCGGDPDARIGELAHHFLSAAPRGDISRAIDYADRAGVQAMGQLAYEEAAELYDRALEVLELSDEPDEALRCRLLLCLGGAHTGASRFTDASEAFHRAASSARAIGSTDRLVGAAIGLSVLSEAGVANQQLIDLCDEALAAIAEGPSAQRAALLTAKAQETYWIDAQGESARLSEEAVEVSREVGDKRALAAALQRLYFIPIGPDDGEQRLQIIDEMLKVSEECGDREMVVRCHAYRLREYLELGDIDAVDRELAEYARLAQELRMPQHIWHIYALQSMRALVDGDIEESERLAEESRDRGARAEQPLAAQYYGIQVSQIRRFQGRSEELRPAVRELAERYPAIPAWRTALISLNAISGNVEEGRVELERFAGEDFSAIARDAVWITAMGLLGEATALLGDSKRAQLIYDELLPYDGLVIIAARAAASNGPASRILGLLAGAAGRNDDAIRHFESAIELSTRMGDRPYLALGRANLADALLKRDGGGDRERALELLGEALSSAREIGARFVADQALASRLEAQGLAGVDVTTSIDEMVSELEAEQPDIRAHAAPDGTVAILFSDIEDSTIITERLGDQRWLEVLREHNSTFREHLERHDGFEVKSQGDGFMLAFPEPCKALEYAICIQREFAAKAEEIEHPLRVRMGVHTGEVIAEEGDFFGKNVILAARIAAQASGGEILVSEQMRQAAEDHGSQGEDEGIELRFDEGRELELKGLAGSHRVFRAEWESQAAAA